MKLAVIPARGGSVRIPRKNIRLFCGKPMIAWTLDAARASGCFDDIIVSTDDAEIAEVARQHGARVPFLRPSALAENHASTLPVMQHAVEWIEQHGQVPVQVCCIYATAPFVRAGDIREGLRILNGNDCAYVFSVTRYAFPIQRAIRITETGRVEMFQSEYFDTRSQDLEEAFHDAGQFYWGNASAWKAGTPIFSPTSIPIILPRYRVQDIDTLEDWEQAELMFKYLQENI